MTRISFLPRCLADASSCRGGKGEAAGRRTGGRAAWLLGTLAVGVMRLQAADPVFPVHPNATDSPAVIPSGKTLVMPVACDDADGDALTYTVTSSNPHVFARVKTGNPHVKIHVHTDNDGSGS